MGIANILSKIRCPQLKYAAMASALIALFCCSPLWASTSDRQQLPPVLLPNYYQSLSVGYQSIQSYHGYLAKRGSRDRNYQQWQNLSPEERDKLRKKYQEWQSLPQDEQEAIRRRLNQLNRMPSQKRKLYKQLFRQWQHLPPDERQQLQRDLDNWDYLSPQQQNSIRRRFHN